MRAPSRAYLPASATGSRALSISPREGLHISFVFQHREDNEEASDAARDAADHTVKTINGKQWYAVRFDRSESDSLRHFNDKLGERKDVYVLVNDVPRPLGRRLWLPLMYILDVED